MRVNVKKMRRSMHMTQVEFAEKLGCAQTYISLTEGKERSTTPEFYTRLCDTFGKDTVDNFIEPDLSELRHNSSSFPSSEKEYLIDIINSQKKQIDNLIEVNKKLVEQIAKNSDKIG